MNNKPIDTAVLVANLPAPPSAKTHPIERAAYDTYVKSMEHNSIYLNQTSTTDETLELAGLLGDVFIVNPRGELGLNVLDGSAPEACDRERGNANRTIQQRDQSEVVGDNPSPTVQFCRDLWERGVQVQGKVKLTRSGEELGFVFPAEISQYGGFGTNITFGTGRFTEVVKNHIASSGPPIATFGVDDNKLVAGLKFPGTAGYFEITSLLTGGKRDPNKINKLLRFTSDVLRSDISRVGAVYHTLLPTDIDDLWKPEVRILGEKATPSYRASFLSSTGASIAANIPSAGVIMIKLFRRDGLHCQPRFTPPKNSLAAVPRNNKLRLRYEIIEANYSLTLSLNGVSYVLPHKDIKFVGNGYAALISFIEETEVERAKLESLSAVELEERKNLISSMTVNLFDDVDDVIRRYFPTTPMKGTAATGCRDTMIKALALIGIGEGGKGLETPAVEDSFYLPPLNFAFPGAPPLILPRLRFRPRCSTPKQFANFRRSPDRVEWDHTTREGLKIDGPKDAEKRELYRVYLAGLARLADSIAADRVARSAASQVGHQLELDEMNEEWEGL